MFYFNCKIQKDFNNIRRLMIPIWISFKIVEVKDDFLYLVFSSKDKTKLDNFVKSRNLTGW